MDYSLCRTLFQSHFDTRSSATAVIISRTTIGTNCTQSTTTRSHVRRRSHVLSTCSNVDEFCWQHDRFEVEKFSKSWIRDGVPEPSTLVLEITEFPDNTVWDGLKETSVPKPAWFVQSFRHNTGLWQTDGRTDRLRWRWKCTTWKWRTKKTMGLENARVENDGQKLRDLEGL